jgi:hypothetical protein
VAVTEASIGDGILYQPPVESIRVREPKAILDRYSSCYDYRIGHCTIWNQPGRVCGLFPLFYFGGSFYA